MNTEEQIWEISQRDEVLRVGGFSVYIYGKYPPVKGFCVGYSDTQDFFGYQGMCKAIKHAQIHCQIVGGWRKAGRFYFDSVRVYHTEKNAIEASIRESQIGYFKLGGAYIETMTGGKLRPKYRKLLDKINENRERIGMEPFKQL